MQTPTAFRITHPGAIDLKKCSKATEAILEKARGVAYQHGHCHGESAYQRIDQECSFPVLVVPLHIAAVMFLEQPLPEARDQLPFAVALTEAGGNFSLLKCVLQKLLIRLPLAEELSLPLTDVIYRSVL